jgi:hypothetical protein
MGEQDRTQLPLVETFGENLQRAMASRARSRRRSQRRALGAAVAAGLVGVSLLTPPGQAASNAVGEWLGLAEPGDPATVEPRLPRPGGDGLLRPDGAVVLAAGRAPDGVRYEFVLDRFDESDRPGAPGEAFGRCLNLEWPDARTGQINPQFGCFETFPPRMLDRAVIRAGGTLFDSTYTDYVQIAGLVRADASDVRIRYKDEHGVRRDAVVQVARVTGPAVERVGADAPFGAFIGFLPPAWLGYGANFDPRSCPPEEHPYDPDALELVAYDHQGQAIATKTANNILSVSGSPPC